MSGADTMSARTSTPWHLWVVGIVAVLFNAIGVFDYVMVMSQGASYLKAAGMTEPQIAHYMNLPLWMMVVWTVGVWGAIIASALLLLRSAYAFHVFALSLAAFLVNVFYTYVLSDGGQLMGQSMVITSVMITALLLFFLFYSRAMTGRGVLR